MRSRPLATAIAALLVTDLAAAQDAASTAVEADSDGLGEIIVTANRREENLQKAPITVTALGAEDLAKAGTQSFGDLTGAVPSLTVGSDGMVFLRGFGNTDTREEGAPTVAIYQDGVYGVLPWFNVAMPYDDIQRVEVLTGPQGTLFGRNSPAGAINAITNAPKLDKFEGEVWARFGNYDSKQVGGVLNLPLSERTALRIVGSSDSHTFYNPSPDEGPEHGLNSKDVQSVRATFLFQATDNLKFTLRGTTINDNSLRGNFGINTVELGEKPKNFNSPVGLGLSNHAKYYTITGQMDWNVGPGTLTYMGNYTDTAYFNDNQGFFNGPGPASRLFQDIRTNSNQNELRFSGTTDRFKYVAGLFQFHMKQGVNVGLPALLDIGLEGGPGYFSFLQNPQVEDSKAIYGQTTFAVSDRFNLTGGLRYTEERKERDGVNAFQYAPGEDQPPLYYGPYDDSRTVITGINYARGKWTSTDWKVGFDFEATDTNMLYGNVGTGFKTGGYDDGVNRTFKPEHVTTVEVGSKNRFMEDKVQVNLVAYRSDYKDLQIAGTGYDEVTGLAYGATVNAAKASTTGLEVDLRARPTKADNIGLTLGLMDAKYGNFPTGELGDTWHTEAFNYKGNRLRAAPRVTGTVSYSHDFEMGNGGTLTPDFRVRYTSSQYMHYTNFPISKQDSYTNSSFTLTYAKDKWQVRAFVRNIENDVVYANVTPNNPTDTAIYYLQDPRTYGIGVNVRFE